MNIWPPQDQVFWYLQRNGIKPCTTNIETEVAIIGGGMAGLTAAQRFMEKGKKVVLLEQYYCGAGATGKSSGFITPNAELSFSDFGERYDFATAHKIWTFFSAGVEHIRNNIKTYSIECDYLPQNTLMLANNKSTIKELQTEHENLKKYGYKTHFYPQKEIKNYINSNNYFGGVEYEDSFGIDGYLYCQGMKEILQKQGVIIFEETPVTSIDNHILKTQHATITADSIIICADRFLPQLGFLTKEVYHAQTFLMISQSLSQDEIALLYPHKNYLAWDTDLIYSYFRVARNNRLLLGGGSMLTTLSSDEQHNYRPIIKKLTNYFKDKFPQVNVQFEYVWPGLIGLSKDTAPLAGRDKQKPYIYFISAVAGLPIAAALGTYSAEHIIEGRDDLDSYFSPYRSFFIGGFTQTLLGKKISFGISNLMSHYFPGL